MNAEVVTRNSEREKLANLLPLSTPLSVHVQSSNICNFKCNYCAQSLSIKEFKDMKIDRKLMTYDLFKIIADQIGEFPGKIKVLNLTGYGEPLLNKDLPKMISYAQKIKIAHRTEIVTNGYFLNNEMADRLISSGLDVLRISIQGLSSDKYKKISNISIDFNQYVDNIRYFFKKRGKCSVYIKILDSSLDEIETKERFYEIFGDLCDSIAVEHLVPVMSGVDYSKIQSDFKTGMQGYINENIQICPRPFYMLVVNLDGTVRPCCNYAPPMLLGNIAEKSIKEYWNGEKMKKFRLMQIYKERHLNNICNKCPTPVYGLHAEDDLDEYAEKLIALYSV